MAHHRADYRNERAQVSEERAFTGCDQRKDVVDPCDCKTLYYLNFGNCNVDLPRTLDVQSFDGLVGRSELGLVIDSRVFTQTVPQGELGRLDYYKFFAAVDKSFPLEQNKDTTFEAWIAGQQFFNEDVPIPPAFITTDAGEPIDAISDIRADPRLASAGYMLVDDANGLFFGHLLTDNAHYAVYGRNDFARLRQAATGGLLGMNAAAGMGGNGLSIANILGLNLEDIVMDGAGLSGGLMPNIDSLAGLASLGGGFRIMANGTNGWDMDKCKKKRCNRNRNTACGDNDCYGIDPRQLLSYVNTASHLNFVRIDTREGSGALTNFVKAGVRFRINQDAVDWLINGIKVFTLIGIGEFIDPQFRAVRSPGDAFRVQPCEVRFCFGTFSFLDAARPGFDIAAITNVVEDQAEFGALVQLAEADQYVIPIAGQDGEVVEVTPEEYFATAALGNDPTLRLFGQGAVLMIKDVRMKVCDSKYNEYIYDELGNQLPNIDLLDDCCDPIECEESSSTTSTSSYTTIEAKVRKCPVKKIKVVHHDAKEKDRRAEPRERNAREREVERKPKEDCGCNKANNANKERKAKKAY